MHVMAMVNVKNTINDIHRGVFQNKSNWHIIPVNIKTMLVTAEKVIPTTVQLTQ